MPAPELLHELSIAEAGALLRSGSLTARALTEHALGRISAYDPVLHSFVLITQERALADADRADRELASGIDRGPLHGIPYALKDIYETAGIRTTCHSKLLLDHVPSNDCFVEAKLKDGGAVLLGKLATHEFAVGGPSFDLPFPPARNPWNRDHFPGGSSSGSGAAVAAGLVRMAMGSDTGGSIRGPAAYCGTIGLKPTYGRVSRRGVFPLSYTLDHCGPLSRSVEDTALTMQVIAGHDSLDPASADVPVPEFAALIGKNLNGLKIAYPRNFFVNEDDTSPEVVAAIDAAVQTIAQLGADIEEVTTFPNIALFNACGRVILTAEAYAIHEHDLKTRPMDYGRFAYQRMMPGATLTAADLTQAFRLRRELASFINDEILGRFDAIVTANALAPAIRLDQFPPDASFKISHHTMPFNVTGHPALAIPTGFSKSGLPIGMQIVGRPFDEPTVLQIGAAYEAVASWTAQRPDLKQTIGA
ncbi:MAG TPA: amidase [Xanthobacteraceae bacterium]|jgi:aspartyl-tRNA(Asn)/glutamyl-tRNA(Gln) amidotransferase subunit A|nr:amidase [Xanthobacteraceae bacterium]